MHGPTSPDEAAGRGAPGASAAVYAEKLAALGRVDRRASAQPWALPARESAPCTSGRGPVCGMIIRGGAAMGSAGFVGAAACICVTFEGGWVAGGALPTGVAGGMRAEPQSLARSTGGC